MSEPRTVVPEDQTSGGLTHRQVLIILSGLMLGMLLAALDQTIVATALPTIVGDLHGLNHLSWVVTAYLLTTTLSTPLYGKISDLHGRKKVFQFAIVMFLVGSALSGLSQNMDQLIAFRALQGLGGGGLMALAMAIVGDIVSPRERGRYQGYFGGVFALASIGGPLAGGFLTDHLTWRWIFYINIPVGILALIITSAVLRLPLPTRTVASIDYTGAGLIVAAVTPLILVTVWGGRTLSWTSPTIIGLVIVSLAMMGAVVWWERRAREPIFPPRVFANSIVRTGLGMTFFVTATMFAAIIYIPVYLQLVDGESATRSGVLLLPLMGGMLTTSIVSGRLVTRFGRYKVYPVCRHGAHDRRDVVVHPSGGTHVIGGGQLLHGRLRGGHGDDPADRGGGRPERRGAQRHRQLHLGGEFLPQHRSRRRDGVARHGAREPTRVLAAAPRPCPQRSEPVLVLHDHPGRAAETAARRAGRGRGLFRSFVARRVHGGGPPRRPGLCLALFLKDAPLHDSVAKDRGAGPDAVTAGAPGPIPDSESAPATVGGVRAGGLGIGGLAIGGLRIDGLRISRR